MDEPAGAAREPLVDLAAQVYVRASPPRVAARLRDPALWRRCWPELKLTPYHDRGDEGLRWYVRGRLVGTAEVWLEPYRGTVVVHAYLRADPRSGSLRRRPLGRLRERYARALYGILFAVKDERERRGDAEGHGLIGGVR